MSSLYLILCKFHRQQFSQPRISSSVIGINVLTVKFPSYSFGLFRFQTTINVKPQVVKIYPRKKKVPKKPYQDLIKVLEKYQTNLTSPKLPDNVYPVVTKNVPIIEKSKSFKSKDIIQDEKISNPKGKVTKSSSSGKTKSGSKSSKLKSKKIEEDAFNNKLAKGTAYFASLKSYIDVCLRVNMHKEAHSVLKTFKFEGNEVLGKVLFNSGVFEVMIQGWASKGNLEMLKELVAILQTNNKKLSLKAYISWLECLGRQPVINLREVSLVLSQLKLEGYELQKVFTNTKFIGNQREIVLNLIRKTDPSFEYKLPEFPTKYSCNLVQNLNESFGESKVCPSMENVCTKEELQKYAMEQFEIEKMGHIKVKNICRRPDNNEKIWFYRKQLENHEKEWKLLLKHSFLQNLECLWNEVKSLKKLSIYPYLAVLEPDEYVEIMLREIRNLAEASETFSPGINFLSRVLATQVMKRYLTWHKQQEGINDKILMIYQQYLSLILDKQDGAHYTQRDIFSKLVSEAVEGPSIDTAFVNWPSNVLSEIGRFLYDIIINEVKISPTILKSKTPTRKKFPGFYKVFRRNGLMLKEEIKPHPLISKLYRGAESEHLHFNMSLVPMVSPPLPWSSPISGGFLINPTEFVRQEANQYLIEKECPLEQLYPSFDSLNILGVCPWVINKPLLDLIIDLFNKNGSKELDVPQPPSVLPKPEKITKDCGKTEKAKLNFEKLLYRRKKAEMFSLWCDALYKLSIANHFRDRIFWFPHNMDFRGRVYPTPPHFNHLGSDLVRSILLFAKGEPLGEKGLDWLKIHLINLTGLKKKSSIKDRLNYANEILDDILDSADNPFDGKKWWMKSDEPWQTLACCMEIAKAVRSPDPVKYISHFPVHQDGSCNGLQHYAALGRDLEGAQQVNLFPSHLPQDVYSGVANLVEMERAADASNGVKIAQALEGFVARKVVKQTVMTIVYGVTRYGARLQIYKQLKDIDEFPEDCTWAASVYLMQKTFLSIQKMFTATRLIQDWFTECAQLISKIRGEPVSWVTPLGFPIMQPYHKISNQSSKFKSNPFQRNTLASQPNTLKQKNAFPPNFIHSLDSCHMMLTSLYCQRKGIVFVSVHDCYWTHPNTVDLMNTICREQFVSLHSQPILDDLSKYLVEKFAYSEKDLDTNEPNATRQMKMNLNEILVKIPQRGTFDLKSVLNSTYFFS